MQNEAALPLLLAALRRRGRAVPAELSIVAICPGDLAEQQEVPLTFVDLPASRLGAAAVDMSLCLLDRGGPLPTRLLPPVLAERESCRTVSP